MISATLFGEHEPGLDERTKVEGLISDFGGTPSDIGEVAASDTEVPDGQ